MNRTARGEHITDAWHSDLSITVRMLEIQQQCVPSTEHRDTLDSIGRDVAQLRD